MKTRTSTTTQAARWGWLVATLIMGFVLVIVSLLGYLGARDAAGAVVRARAMDLLLFARRSFVLMATLDQPSMENLLVDLKSQGLRYLGVFTPSGEELASAGTPLEASSRQLMVRPGMGPAVQADWEAGRVQAVAPLGAGHGRRGLGFGRRRWESPGSSDWNRRGPGQPGSLLVVEFEPLVAASLIVRAGWTLVLSLAAAGLLLLVALVFFRLSRRAERFQNQLEKERQLAALGEMSAVLGHELRNPLASLKGHAQLLLEKLSGDHPGRGGAETVLKEVLRLEKLTGQVLDFVRTGQLKSELTSPRQVVEAAVGQVKSQHIQIEQIDDLPDWPMDRARMQQVLVNLLGNAVKASPQGAKVTIGCRAEGGRLVFWVRDHGQGLQPGEDKRVFEPFYTRSVKGTGLGLAVVKRIVQGHGGTIEAENHPQGGAVFTVRLPP